MPGNVSDRGLQNRVDNGAPGQEVQAAAGAYNAPPAWQAPTTLAGQLVPVADALRTLKARLGIRPYRCFLVHAKWTGPRKGFGECVLLSRREILPVPRVRDMQAVRQSQLSTGRTEEGDVFVDEITARLTEDDLMGATPDLKDPLQSRTLQGTVEFFWEIQESRPSRPDPVIRRFVPTAVPYLSRDNLQWKIALTKQDYDPNRNGTLR